MTLKQTESANIKLQMQEQKYCDILYQGACSSHGKQLIYLWANENNEPLSF